MFGERRTANSWCLSLKRNSFYSSWLASVHWYAYDMHIVNCIAHRVIYLQTRQTRQTTRFTNELLWRRKKQEHWEKSVRSTKIQKGNELVCCLQCINTLACNIQYPADMFEPFNFDDNFFPLFHFDLFLHTFFNLNFWQAETFCDCKQISRPLRFEYVIIFYIYINQLIHAYASNKYRIASDMLKSEFSFIFDSFDIRIVHFWS